MELVNLLLFISILTGIFFAVFKFINFNKYNINVEDLKSEIELLKLEYERENLEMEQQLKRKRWKVELSDDN